MAGTSSGQFCAKSVCKVRAAFVVKLGRELLRVRRRPPQIVSDEDMERVLAWKLESVPRGTNPLDGRGRCPEQGNGQLDRRAFAPESRRSETFKLPKYPLFIDQRANAQFEFRPLGSAAGSP